MTLPLPLMMSRPLADQVWGVATRDRWRTPRTLVEGVAKLLGGPFDLDAFAEESAHHAPRYLTAKDDALSCSWGDFKRAWANPPFADVGERTKVAIVSCCGLKAEEGRLVALLLPFTASSNADGHADLADCLADCRIDIAERIRFEPPPGIMPSSPNQTPHRVWIFGHAPHLPPWCRLDWRTGEVVEARNRRSP